MAATVTLNGTNITKAQEIGIAGGNSTSPLNFDDFDNVWDDRAILDYS